MSLSQSSLKILTTLAFLIFMSAVPNVSPGQETVVRGTVTDQEGNPLEEAKITFLDPARGLKFNLKSDKNGKFIKVGIPPTVYQITVELEGYYTLQSQARIRFGQEEQLNIKLEKIPPSIDEDRDLAAGIEFFEQGQYDQAVACFKKVIEKFPGNLSAHYNLGLTYLRKGEIDQAITVLEKAVELNPEVVEVYFALGESYFSKGENEKAKEIFSRAIEIQPDNPQAHYNLGITYYKYDKLEEALASFKKTIQLDPGFSSAYYQAGLTLIKKGEHEDAIHYFEQFLSLEPDAPEADQIQAMIEELKKQIKNKELSHSELAV
ncbi:MAG: tetratricopeptide repeat protein [Candidatus Aminicenantes bacterium]